MIIAIDGPSASGKGTLARKLATRFGLAHLDTGSLYRAVALKVLAAGADPADRKAAAKAAQALSFSSLDNPKLRGEAVGEAASVVAANPEVRKALLAFQRRFASHPPGGKRGAVIDGRDIGTVVCPGADLKFFVTASPEERARRRTHELEQRGEPADYGQILANIRERDRRDMERENSPLRPAEDAHLLDTTKLDIDGAFEKALDVIASKGLF